MSKKAILAELKRLYPDAGPELHFTNPYETLVATMLSAQCTDKQVNKVTPEVFARYPDATAMAACTACRMIVEKHGGQVPSTMEELTALPGVGRKTANVVLANAFGVPAIAVDTHVFRVSNRLGLADASTVEETERQLMKAIPKSDWRDAHHWLIFHGRRVCKAQHPLCESCTLRPLCKAAKAQQAAQKKAKAGAVSAEG